MKSIIITDAEGGTLKLTSTKLIELIGGTNFYLKLKDFATAFKTRTSGRFNVRIKEIGNPRSTALVGAFVPNEHNTAFQGVLFDQGRIGCRVLSGDDFNKIVKVAKATLRSKKTTTVVKAKAAAAGRAKR